MADSFTNPTNLGQAATAAHTKVIAANSARQADAQEEMVAIQREQLAVARNEFTAADFQINARRYIQSQMLQIKIPATDNMFSDAATLLSLAGKGENRNKLRYYTLSCRFLATGDTDLFELITKVNLHDVFAAFWEEDKQGKNPAGDGMISLNMYYCGQDGGFVLASD